MAVTYRVVESFNRNVRRLCEQDLPEVLEIECRGYSFPWTEAVFRDCFRPDYRLWGVELSGALIGYAVVVYIVDEAHLLNICITPQHRRSGMARYLLRRLVAEAVRDGMVRVILEVRVSNQSAAALYLAEGFVDIGLRPGYYPSSSGREDARVLALSMADSSH